MATTMLQSPRPSTSAGAPLKMSLPTIEHPMSRRDHGDMTVRGDVSVGRALQREKTFVAMREGGKLQLGLDRSGLPPVAAASRAGSRGSTQTRHSWSGDYAGRIHSGRGKFRRSIDEGKQLSAVELEHIIQETFLNGGHGMKHLFRSNDPNGQGTVTREGLLKILYNIVGYVSADTFSKLLKKMDLDHRTQIRFEDFTAHFKDKQVKHAQWFSPAQKIEVQKKPNQEEHLKDSEPYNFRNPRITASTCHTLLRDRLRQKGHDMLFAFPESCRGRHSLILPQHLVEILRHLDISVSEDDFFKLWTRYDREAVGCVKRSQLFSMLGLDDVGNIVIPRTSSEVNFGNPYNTPTGSELNLKSQQKLPTLSKYKTFLKDRTGTDPEPPIRVMETPKREKPVPEAQEKPVPEAPIPREVPASSRSKRSTASVISTRKRGAPKLDYVIDALHFKFEEGYYSLLMGLQCFDFLGDGLISKRDFKRVLDEFGIRLPAMDFDHFFSKIGVKCSNAQVSYKDFLMKFWNKGDSGLVNRILSKNTHIFTKGGSLPAADVDLTEEQFEAKVVQLLHKEFLQLLNALKKADKYKIGVVTRHEFKDALDRALGYTMSHHQWTSVKHILPLDSDGLAIYPKFLEIFATSQPGKWNTQDIGGNAVVQTQRNAPAIVEKLQDDSKKDLKARQHDFDELKQDNSEYISLDLKNKLTKNIDELKGSHKRPLKQLNSLLKEFFKQRFNDADKAFKLMDRRMTGRLSKDQLGDILKQCGMDITRAELDELWGTFRTGQDGMASFTSLINHFSDFGKTDDQVKTHIPESEKTELPTYEFHGKYHYAYQNVETQAAKNPEFKDKLRTLREKFNLSTAGSSRHGNTDAPQGREGADMLSDIINKIKPLAQKHWGHLKSIIRYADKDGNAYIHGSDMQDVMQMMHFPLNPVEMRRLLRAFDCTKNGRFHYINFLKMVGGKMDADNSHNSQLSVVDKEFQQKNTSHINGDASFLDLLESMKEKVIRDFKPIRKAFKKADLEAEGFLTVKDFKNVLRSCGFKVSPEDLYHILSEFDSSMDGRIFYEDFLSQISGKV